MRVFRRIMLSISSGELDIDLLPETRKIYYTATAKVESSYSHFGAKIIYSEWDSITNEGVIVCDRDITNIDPLAFKDYQTSLTSITIPDSVTSIWSGTFYGFTKLTSVTIGNSVTKIEEHAFYDCESLTSVTIPNSVTLIGREAFYGCSRLTSVTIPDSVTYIGYRAFYYCGALTSVYCKPTTPPTGDSYMFDENAAGRIIYVPTDSASVYRGTTNWARYRDAIREYDFN